MDKKTEEILEIIKENAPCHIDTIHEKVKKAKIYTNSLPIAKTLRYLESLGRIRVKNFRVEINE
jgi:DNA-binding Lrp family transcriptional regulator